MSSDTRKCSNQTFAACLLADLQEDEGGGALRARRVPLYVCPLASANAHSDLELTSHTDVGNGTYEPIYGQVGVPPAQPVNYGATSGNYVR